MNSIATVQKIEDAAFGLPNGFYLVRKNFRGRDMEYKVGPNGIKLHMRGLKRRGYKVVMVYDHTFDAALLDLLALAFYDQRADD